MTLWSKQNEAELLVKAERPLHYERESFAHRVPNHCLRSLASQAPQEAYNRVSSNSGTIDRKASVEHQTERVWVLDLDGFTIQKRPWSNKGLQWWEEADDSNPQAELFPVCWRDTGWNVHLPQMRRSGMRQSGSSLRRHPIGQCFGSGFKRTASSPERFNARKIEIGGIRCHQDSRVLRTRLVQPKLACWSFRSKPKHDRIDCAEKELATH